MKIFKTIIVWALISLVVQFLGMYYVNNYFLSSSTNIKTEKVVEEVPEEEDVDINIPDDAENIKLSFDGMYVAYYYDGFLKVVDTKTGDIEKISFDNGAKLSFYKWLPDRDRMLIAEKEISNNRANFKLKYFDVDKNIKEDIKELSDFSEGTEIKDIEESPLTNVAYIKMQDKGNRTTIYRLNIMSEIQRISTNSYMVGDIGILSLKDKLIYEDKVYNKIYISGEDRPLYIDGVENLAWIGVDSEDNIYVGDLENEKIRSIYYGSIDKDTSSYEKVDIGEYVDKSDIYISNSGRIYVNDNLKGIVRDVLNGKEYIYQGKFIQINEGEIASVSDGKLIKTLIN
jgi:hypothetical protein